MTDDDRDPDEFRIEPAEWADPVFQITWGDDADGVPLVCGRCRQEIVVTLNDGRVVDSGCGCEPRPDEWSFKSVEDPATGEEISDD